MDTGVRHYLLFVLLLVIPEVSVQGVAVDAVVGDNVILMCSASRSENGVFWQYENTKSVYDIIDGKENSHDQDAAYKGRVKGFPSEFSKGNYSITLRDVKLTDAGSYICSIPNTKPAHVELRVEEKRTVLGRKTNEGNGGVMRREGGLSVTVTVLLYVLLGAFAA